MLGLGIKKQLKLFVFGQFLTNVAVHSEVHTNGQKWIRKLLNFL